MKNLTQIASGIVLSAFACSAAMPAMAAAIGGNQLTVTSSIPTGSSRFPLTQINDGIKSDANPFNGFQGRNRTTGVISFGLDQTYRLTGFKLWNDINVREEGVKGFRLEFLDANNAVLTSHSFTAQAGLTNAQTFTFPAVDNVKKVNMHVQSFLPGRGIVRTEIREVEFVGEKQPRGGMTFDQLTEKLKAECVPCFGRKVNVVLGGKVDNFAGGPTEKPSPRSGFNGINSITSYNSGRSGITRDYDEVHANEFFIETLKVPNAATAQKGWVVFRAKDRGGLVTTDSIYMGDVLGYFQEVQAAKQQGRSRNDIHARVFGKKYTDFKSQLNPFGQAVFNVDAASGFVYANLADVELTSKSHSGTTNLLEQIKTDQQMDFLIQDDTGIDFLAVITCSPNPKGKTHVSAVKSRGLVPREIKKYQRRTR